MGALHIRGTYFHAFQTNGQIGHTCVGPQKLGWPRSPRSLNPSLTVVTSVPYSITFASRYKKLWCHRNVDCKKIRVFSLCYVAALCNLGFTIWGSYMEQVWPPWNVLSNYCSWDLISLLSLFDLLKKTVCIPCPINSNFELEASYLQ